MNIGMKCGICNKTFEPKVPHQKRCGSRECNNEYLRRYDRSKSPNLNPITGWTDERMPERIITLEPVKVYA
jgi:hypothetical protein